MFLCFIKELWPISGVRCSLRARRLSFSWPIEKLWSVCVIPFKEPMLTDLFDVTAAWSAAELLPAQGKTLPPAMHYGKYATQLFKHVISLRLYTLCRIYTEPAQAVKSAHWSRLIQWSPPPLTVWNSQV